MNKKAVISIVSLMVITALVGVSVFTLTSEDTEVRTQADSTVTPVDVRITNISENGFSISWQTEKATTAFIKYGVEPGSLTTTISLEDYEVSALSRNVHHFTLKALRPNTVYYFKIYSDTKEFDAGGVSFSQKTAKVIDTPPPPPDPIYGRVVGGTGVSLIYIDMEATTPISTITKVDGTWATALNNARSADLTAYSVYDPANTPLNILAISGGSLTGSLATVTANDAPTADITLSGVSDNSVAVTSTDQFSLQTPVPVEVVATPVPAVTPLATSTPIPTVAPTVAPVVTVDLPANDTYMVTIPTFEGTAPAGVVMDIVINSETQITGKVTVDEDGNWTFTPDQKLEPGEHTITASYTDQSGKKVTQTFEFNVLGTSDTVLPESGVGGYTIILLIIGLMAIFSVALAF